MSNITFDDLTKGTNIFNSGASEAATETPIDIPKTTQGFGSLADSLLASEENIKINADKIEHDLAEPTAEASGEAANSATTEAPKATEGKRPQFLNGKSAKMYVVTFDILCSRIAAGWAGEPEYKKYKLDPTDKAEFEKICKEYFESVDIEISPTTMFIMLNVMFFGGTMWKAWGDKNKSKEAAERKRELDEKYRNKKGELEVIRGEKSGAAQTDNREEKDEEEEREEIIDNFNRASSQVKRTRFEITKQGYYKRDDNGDYIKKADQIEKPAEDILQLINEGKSNAEIKKYLNLIVAEQMKK